MAVKLFARLASLPFSQTSVSLNGIRLASKIRSPVQSVSSFNLEEATNRLVIRWKDEVSGTDAFPLVWLRDNCQCPLCFASSSQSRAINLGNFKLDQKPKNTELVGDSVEVVWDDDHKSLYSLKWLKERSFSKAAQKAWLESNRPLYQTWDSEFFKNIPVRDFNDVMVNDEVTLQWLLQLENYGLCILENVPSHLGNVRKVIERVGFIKKTHYGEDFSVASKSNASNIAYTRTFLQLHTDLPYYEYMPGVNFLHCHIQYQGEGGDSLWTDGFHIAELLKKHDPAAFKILSETDVSWSDIGRENGYDFDQVLQAPVISLSKSGNIQRINFSQPQRNSHMPVPIEQVEDWYRALKTFHNLAQAPENLITHKLQPSQMVTFNNQRILHGRTAFGNDTKGERHVEGAYLDWDEVRSRIRVLKKKLANST